MGIEPAECRHRYCKLDCHSNMKSKLEAKRFALLQLDKFKCLSHWEERESRTFPPWVAWERPVSTNSEEPSAPMNVAKFIANFVRTETLTLQTGPLHSNYPITSHEDGEIRLRRSSNNISAKKESKIESLSVDNLGWVKFERNRNPKKASSQY